MIIKRLEIKNFGKIHDRKMELSPGINVLYGDNEGGKTTAHAFIRGMFYGIRRQRGKAAKNDPYTTYEPWENPVVYGGTMWFENAGRNFRLTRNFHKTSVSQELLCEDDGELLDVEKGDLEMVLGDVGETVFNNTVSVAQLKSVTGPELARELQNYMASYQGTGDSNVDLGRAVQMLKMSRKGFQMQAGHRKKDVQKEQEKLKVSMEYVQRELDELQERREEVEDRQKSLHMTPGDEDGLSLMDGRITLIRRRKTAAGIGMILLALLAAWGIYFLGTQMADALRWQLLTGAAALILLLLGGRYEISLTRELVKRRGMKARWLQRQDKLKWSMDSLSESEEEKRTALSNLQTEYKDYEEASGLPTQEDVEIQALNMALETIELLSSNIHRQVGVRLRERTSEILWEITAGRYNEVLIDKDLHMAVNTTNRVIPLERLSRGTIEQIYFALRMAAGELLCQEERFPIILDDVFGMYDEERLKAVLHWLHKEERQVILLTCHKREAELMERESIPFNHLKL